MTGISRAPVFVDTSDDQAKYWDGSWQVLQAGAQGPKGDKGDTGLKGDKGDTGLKGDKGDTGLKGDKGDTGLKGDKGDPGTTPTLPAKTSTRTLTAAQAFTASTWTTINLNSSASTAGTTDVGWPALGTAQIQTTGTYLVTLAFTTDLTSAVSGRITVNGAVTTGSTFGGTAAFKSGGTISTTLNLTSGQQVAGSIWSAAAGNISADNPGASTLARLSVQRLLVAP